MGTNTYAGLLEDWKVRLIRQRARRRGFRGQDLDEAVQRSVIALLRFQFDESRSNGAAESTVLTAIVDRQLAMMRRSATREKQRIECVATLCEESYELSPKAEVIEAVQIALATLPASDRRICELLAEGCSKHEIATRCGIGWHSASAAIERIQRHLERNGLADFVLKSGGAAA